MCIFHQAGPQKDTQKKHATMPWHVASLNIKFDLDVLHCSGSTAMQQSQHVTGASPLVLGVVPKISQASASKPNLDPVFTARCLPTPRVMYDQPAIQVYILPGHTS